MPGLIVDTITPGSTADRAGLRVHDVLYKYNGTLLNVTEDLLGAIRRGAEQNSMTVIRSGETIEIDVPSGPLGIVNRPFPALDTHIPGAEEALNRLHEQDQPESFEKQKARRAEMLGRIAGIQITTAPHLEGWRVVDTLDIIAAEHVAGINILKDILAGFTDLLGGRSKTMQNALREARQTCLVDLKTEAHLLGANAVIAVALDYSEISGGGKSMLFLVASGTAVIVEKT